MEFEFTGLKMGISISIQKKIVDFCKHWNITALVFFRSVLQDDFESESDIDVLINLRRRISQEMLLIVIS